MAITGHEAGVWKQQNKTHKTGRHRSKRQVDGQNKGRVDVKTSSKRQKKSSHKSERRKQLQIARQQKRGEVLNRKRSVGVGHSPPHLTAIIPLHHDVNVCNLSQSIKQSCGNDGGVVSESLLSTAGFTLNIPRLKHRFQVIQPGSPTHADVLDCVQVADTVIFLVSCDENEPLDEFGRSMLSCLLAQGISSMVFCVQGMKDLAVKLRNPTKKGIMKKLEHFVSSVKFFVVDCEQDVYNLLRSVAGLKRKSLGIRRGRSYMLAEKINFVCDKDSDLGSLEVSGHVRGFPLDVNRLVHVVGWGNYQINHINEVAEHCPWNVRRLQSGDDIEDSKVVIRGQAYHPWQSTGVRVNSNPSAQEDLTPVADVDPMEGEQTWPTEEEIREATEAAVKKTRKMKKKVPKGTSEYQAAWILDSDEDWEEDESGDESMVDSEMDLHDDLHPQDEELSQADDRSVHFSESVLDDTESLVDEAPIDNPDELALFREERSHEMFPDEVDTPKDVPARVRFQRYRGLQSFRNSTWDPKENLPMDYAKIFQFQSFNRTKKKVRSLQADEENTVKPGSYVTVHLKNVPRSFVEGHPPSSPLTLFSLLPHEQKMSVLHFALKQTEEITIRNKTELLFQVGFRRFRAKPVFSQHTLGAKHKMERFFPKQGVVIATVYAPITFPPANVLAFMESKDDCRLVATGALYKIDPDRIMVKRIVLSGHPYRIHRRTATIRYMFFNRDDISWFKPVELKTKWGRRGHIREPVGTHGHMKCIFDDQMPSQDTVLMMLYKRVFPKWSFEAVTPLNKDKCNTNDIDDKMLDEFFNG